MIDAEVETANRKKQTIQTKATRFQEIDVSFWRISKTAIFDYSAWKKNNYNTRFTVVALVDDSYNVIEYRGVRKSSRDKSNLCRP